MSSWISAIAKGAAYLYGGGGDEEKEDNDNEYNNEEQKQQQLNAQQYTPKNVYASAKGELWKFNPKREEFKILLNSVEALIIEHDSNDFLSSFQIIRKNGQLLFSETISNELQIQYNKKNHSMVFAMYNESKDRLEILSFIFNSNDEEEQFKMGIAIKLYETNRQETFDNLLKKNDVKQEEKSYITQTFETEPINDDYIDDDIDLQDLDDDVNMIDMNDTFDSLNINANDDNDTFDVVDDDEEDEEEEEDEYEYKKENKWEEAANKAYSDEDDLNEHTDKILPPSPFKDDLKPSRAARNRHITGSKLFNRTYVVRSMNKNQSALGYFKHNDENELEYQGKIDIVDTNNKHFTPTKAVQYRSDREMLLLNDKKPGMVSVLNLDKGKTVEEWHTKDEEEGGLNDITGISKHSGMSDIQNVYGINGNSVFMIDGRIPKKTKIVPSKSKTYATKNIGFNTISTSGNGFIAIGSNDGKIRLYNDTAKKAKTALPGLGNKIKHIEISDNGLWILATCTDYIMVIPTQVPGTERTGFEGRGMGKLKPHPYILRLKFSDIQKYKLRKVEFTPAHFDMGKNIDEHWITSSTGPYIIKWNFAKVKKSGIINSYSIRKANSKIIHNEFRFGHGDDLLVTETNSVYAQHSTKKKK